MKGRTISPWLLKRVDVKDMTIHIGESIKKINEAGKDLYILCSLVVNHEKRDMLNLRDHIDTKFAFVTKRVCHHVDRELRF